MKKLLLLLTLLPVFCKAQNYYYVIDTHWLDKKTDTWHLIKSLHSVDSDSVYSKDTVIIPHKSGLYGKDSGLKFDISTAQYPINVVKYDSPMKATLVISQYPPTYLGNINPDSAPKPAETYETYKGSNTPYIALSNPAYYREEEPKSKTVYKWQDFLKIAVIITLCTLIVFDKIYQIKLPEYGEDE